jgi:hypothetical protein
MNPDVNVSSEDVADQAKASKPNGRWHGATAETVDQLRRDAGADERRGDGDGEDGKGRFACGMLRGISHRYLR